MGAVSVGILVPLHPFAVPGYAYAGGAFCRANLLDKRVEDAIVYCPRQQLGIDLNQSGNSGK